MENGHVTHDYNMAAVSDETQVISGPVWPPENAAVRFEQRHKSQSSYASDGDVSLEGGVVDAMDFRKERYEGQHMGKSHEKIIREPKKMSIGETWAKPSVDSDDVSRDLPKDQDMKCSSSAGHTLNKQRYEHAVERESQVPGYASNGATLVSAYQEGPDSRNSPQPFSQGSEPVNRKTVEKVAPPEITRNVLSIFENGEFTDLHTWKKLNPLVDLQEDLNNGGGVVENSPVVREDVVRWTDFNIAGEELQSGFTRNRLQEWQAKCDSDSGSSTPVKKQVVMERSGGTVSENCPVQRSDVFRESDQLEEMGGVMSALSLQDRIANYTAEKPVERKEFRLDADHSSAVILENEPEYRSDVVREGDAEDMTIQAGKIKNLSTFFVDKSNDSDDSMPKEQIVIDRSRSGPMVTENEPEVLQGVVRENDLQNEERDLSIQSGQTKNIRNRFLDSENDVHTKKEQIFIDRAAGPAMLENEPEVRDGVVRETDTLEDEQNICIESGHARNLANRFLMASDDYSQKKPFQMDLDTGSQVAESKPKVRKDVVKCEDPRNKRGMAPFKMDLAPESGILESTPEVRTDVVKCDEPVYDDAVVMAGTNRMLAERFMNAADESGRDSPRKNIVIDRSGGCVVESTPIQRDDVVKCGGPTGWEINMEEGRTGKLTGAWLNASDGREEPQSDKPAWMIELDAARAKELYILESQPETRDDVVREYDNYEDPEMIPEQHTRNLKNMWKNLESEEDARQRQRGELELIRFTPPREMTPPLQGQVAPPPQGGKKKRKGVSYEPCVFMQNGMTAKIGESPENQMNDAGRVQDMSRSQEMSGSLTGSLSGSMTGSMEYSPSGTPNQDGRSHLARPAKRTGDARAIPPPDHISPSPTRNVADAYNGQGYDSQAMSQASMHGQGHGYQQGYRQGYEGQGQMGHGYDQLAGQGYIQVQDYPPAHVSAAQGHYLSSPESDGPASSHDGVKSSTTLVLK